MATSKCSCGNLTFEIKEVEPRNAKFKHNFIQCTKCGVPVGVIDYRNSAKLIDELKSDMFKGQAAIHASLHDITQRIDKMQKRQ